MANHVSALKAHRQSLKRQLRNKRNRSLVRTAIKRFNHQIQEGQLEQAAASLPSLYSLVDQAVQKTVISKNAAARNKSRLTRRLSLATAKANKG